MYIYPFRPSLGVEASREALARVGLTNDMKTSRIRHADDLAICVLEAEAACRIQQPETDRRFLKPPHILRLCSRCTSSTDGTGRLPYSSPHTQIQGTEILTALDHCCIHVI